MKTHTLPPVNPDDFAAESPAVAETQGPVLAEQVLRLLGKPPDLLRVQARHLWGDYHRVNVFVGENLGAATIAHSFFVRTGDPDRVLHSDPPITRHYA